MSIWEDQITLNSRNDASFETLAPAHEWRASDGHPTNWGAELRGLDASLARDTHPLPTTQDREGYFGPHHFSYWASGLRDLQNLEACAARLDAPTGTYLDLGCASGRVLRHAALESPTRRVIGCDINRRHVDWVTSYLPESILAFQNTSIPTLPLADASIDVVTAYSVFTHIEAIETTWLMELFRILRPGGFAWVTVHTQDTWTDMTPDWPLFSALKNHPDFPEDQNASPLDGERVVFRWKNDRSYSSNVFYTWEYMRRVWGRIFDVVEEHRRLPVFQDVVVLRKPH
ncbi:MAG: class I SAM-dependent methyltransferase [Acidimicrobiales bacterium]